MCHHQGRVLEDYRAGDSVCMECGLVIDRILGGEGNVLRGDRVLQPEEENAKDEDFFRRHQQQQHHRHQYQQQQQQQQQQEHQQHRRRRRRRPCDRPDEIMQILVQCGLDNDSIHSRVMDLYR